MSSSQNYSIDWQAQASSGQGVSKGQVVTDMGGFFAPASTANLALSTSGGYNGIALENAVAANFRLQHDGVVPPDVCGLGTATTVQFCNVDASGNPFRSASSDSTTIGKVLKNGAVVLQLAAIDLGSGLTPGSRTGQIVEWNGATWAAKAPLVFDVLTYDPLVGTVGHDASPGIEAAITDALDAQAIYYAETGRAHQATVLLPAGSVETSRPIRIKNFVDTAAHRARGSNFKLLGRGHATVIRPSVMGPVVVVGQDQLQYSPIVHTGPFAGGTSPALDCHVLSHSQFDGTFTYKYTAQIRHNGCGAADVNGAKSFTFEGWFKEDSGQSSRRIFASSIGVEGVQAGIFDSAWLFQMTDAFGGSKLAANCQMTDGVHVFVTAADVTANVWHHCVLDFDGTTIRFAVDGVVQGTSVPTAGSSLVQKPWEGCALGRGISGVSAQTEQTPNFNGYVGPWRLTFSGSTGQSTYGTQMAGGTYTVPTAPFPVGGSMSFVDKFVLNWDEMQDDLFKFYSTQRTGYLALSMPSDFNTPVGQLEIGDFDIYGNNGASCGGIFCQNTTAHKFHNIDTLLTWFHSWSTNQSYDSLWTECHAESTGYIAFLDADTGGNRYLACSSENAPFHFYAQAPNYYESCIVGTWGQYCSAFRIEEGEVTIHKLFTDNEATTGPSRGVAYVIDGHLVMHGGLTTWGPGHAEPIVSVAGGSVDLDTLAATGGFNLCPAWVDVVRTPTAGKVFVRVKDFANDPKIRHRPAVVSSTGANLGEVVIERDGLGVPIASTVKNRSKCESYQDSTTTTSATPVVICPIPLDQNSTYILDVEVTARDQLTGDSFGVWKSSHTWSRKLTAPVDKGTNGPADPGAVNGSSSGAPPTGWTISQVATDYDKVGIQVTGDASLHLDWVVNASVTRIKGTSSFVDLTGFTIAGMTGVRGFWDPELGYGSGAWNDQTSHANNLTLTGTSAVASGINGHTYIHCAAAQKAAIAALSKGSAGAITLAMVVRAGAQPYPAAMTGADDTLAGYSDGLFDGILLGIKNLSGWALAAGDAINGMSPGTYDVNAGWNIVVLTATTGGALTLYVAGDRDMVTTTSCLIADSKPFFLGGGANPLDVAAAAVFDHVLSDSDHAKLVAYWKNRFAL